jgi:hypothetical protein
MSQLSYPAFPPGNDPRALIGAFVATFRFSS